jgi:glucan-binding YG repeat protein/LmbE family N-acetylglucosaminyl deacetylase
MKRRILFLGILCLLVLGCVHTTCTVNAKKTEKTSETTKTKQKKKNGWVISGKKYKYKIKGEYVKNKIIKIKKKYYYFNKKGICKTGWIRYKNHKYFFDKKKRYAYTGKTIVGSVYYIFKSNGQMIEEKGLYSYKSKYYYIGDKGSLKTGWILVDDSYRFFSLENGKMYTGKKIIDNETYYFNDDGTPYHGVYKAGSYKYFCNSRGQLLKSTLIDYDGKTYWADEKGHFVTGLYTISGEKYYFDENCEMVTGFLRLGKNILFFNNQGVLSINQRITIDGSVYHSDERGYIRRNCWYGDKFLDYSGKENESSVSYSENDESNLNNDLLDSLGLENCTKVMVVAHPDDECLWGGGHLSEGGYFVLCITNGGNSIRNKEFYNAIKESGNVGFMLTYPDTIGGVRSDWSKEANQIACDLDVLFKYKKWGQVVTHNPSGEYGHIQHRMCSSIVSQVYYKNYWSDNLCYFGIHYSKAQLSGVANRLERLPDAALEKKMKLLSLYTSQSNGAIADHSYLAAYENWVDSMDWK